MVELVKGEAAAVGWSFPSRAKAGLQAAAAAAVGGAEEGRGGLGLLSTVVHSTPDLKRSEKQNMWMLINKERH